MCPQLLHLETDDRVSAFATCYSSCDATVHAIKISPCRLSSTAPVLAASLRADLTTDSFRHCRQHLLGNGSPHAKRYSHLVTNVPLRILVPTWVLVCHSDAFDVLSFPTSRVTVSFRTLARETSNSEKIEKQIEKQMEKRKRKEKEKKENKENRTFDAHDQNEHLCSNVQRSTMTSRFHKRPPFHTTGENT